MDQLPNLFDEEGRTWADVQRRIYGRMRRKFPYVDSSMREDAVADAMVDLIAYWQGLKSAQAVGGTLTFNFAVQRGVWIAGRVLFKEAMERPKHEAYTNDLTNVGSRSMASSALDSDNPDDEDLTDLADTPFIFVDPEPTPEEQACEADEEERARAVLAGMSAEELAECFTLFEAGSTRELGEKLGISHVAVQKRQRKAASSLQQLGRKHGLAVA